MKLAADYQGQGPDLVMLHGWGMNSSVWADFARDLANQYRVTRIDLPGHGKSPFDGTRQLTAWSRACLDAAPDRAVWVGWSLGAMLCLRSALLAPSRVAGIVVLAGMPRFVQAEDWRHAMAPETLDQFVRDLHQNHRQTLERFLALQMLSSDHAVMMLKRLKSLLSERPDPQPEALLAGLEILKSTDLREQLSKLVCPTAWIYGNRDTLAPAKASTDLQQWLPGAAMHTVIGAAHTPFLSHPQETYRLVVRALEMIHG
jgi:pimeloyl-[acyl-carrier protein] methyl ester esterase